MEWLNDGWKDYEIAYAVAASMFYRKAARMGCDRGTAKGIWAGYVAAAHTFQEQRRRDFAHITYRLAVADLYRWKATAMPD